MNKDVIEFGEIKKYTQVNWITNEQTIIKYGIEKKIDDYIHRVEIFNTLKDAIVNKINYVIYNIKN